MAKHWINRVKKRLGDDASPEKVFEYVLNVTDGVSGTRTVGRRNRVCLQYEVLIPDRGWFYVVMSKDRQTPVTLYRSGRSVLSSL